MDYELISKSGLSLDRIRNFILVADAGSVTRAAQADNNKQSLFSRQVKDLENFFGTELFHRKGRTIELTESGARLLSIAKAFLASLEDFAEECQLDQRDLRIAAGDSFIHWLLLPQATKLKSATSNANMSFKNLKTQDMPHALLNGDIHLALMRKVAHPEITSIYLGEVTYRLFVPATYKSNMLELADILGQLPLAGMEGKGLFQQSMDSMIRKHGFFVKYAVRCPSFPAMARAVEHLNVAAILPEIAKFSVKSSSCLDFEDLNQLTHSLHLCWNPKYESVYPNLKLDAENIASKLADTLHRASST